MDGPCKVRNQDRSLRKDVLVVWLEQLKGRVGPERWMVGLLAIFSLGRSSQSTFDEG